MLPEQAILITVALVSASITLQGCRGGSVSKGRYGNYPPAVINLDVDPSGPGSSSSPGSSVPISALLVEAMTVWVEQLQNNNSQALVDHSGFVQAIIANEVADVPSQSAQQYSRLSLSAVARLDGEDPTATVYGVPLHQITACHGATVLANFDLLGSAGLPLNITAQDGSSIFVRNTKPSTISQAVVSADTGSKIDLGNLTTSSAVVNITASNGATVTGRLAGSVEITCHNAGYIAIENVLTNGAIQRKACGDALLLGRSRHHERISNGKCQGC